ncbi:bifunctional enoyl-CoA hydratase/phosphate acetyltransferase [bacterium]|nr:bifunctional enoyl-CoA hydratase/phosphate acetyltransferase [bacterium]
MKPVRHLDQLIDAAKSKGKKRLAVAYGQDPHTIEAVGRAVKEGIVDAYLTGDKESIKKVAVEHNVDPSILSIINIPNEKEAIAESVRMVRSGEADILMKGLCSSANYMKGILDKERGLLPPKEVLSHVTVVEVPTYHKLLLLSDVAVIIKPTLEQKIKMVQYCIDVAHSLGIELPKIAMLSAVEKVNPKMPSTLDCALIAKMNQRGQIKGAIIDGPLALDLAVSMESVKIKGVKSEVAGDADVLVFPCIESANAVYKTLVHLAGGRLAAVVTGATAPCVLTSRADTDESKFLSITLAALNA